MKAKEHLEEGWKRVIIYFLGLAFTVGAISYGITGHIDDEDLHLNQEENTKIALMASDIIDNEQEIMEVRKELDEAIKRVNKTMDDGVSSIKELMDSYHK